MFSNFFICLLLILVVIYLINTSNNVEGFKVSNNKNIYESVETVPNKMLYLIPPNSTQPDLDYQDYLNEISGYDSGTRGYDNLTYAVNIAAGLDTK